MTIRVSITLHLIAIINKLKKYDRCDIWNGLKIELTRSGTWAFPMNESIYICIPPDFF